MSVKSCIGVPYYPKINSEGVGNFNVVELPSFKLSAQQQKGHVEVIIEDPRGKIIKPSIKTSDGLYNATFLPEKPGDYLVSIRVNDEDIDGSPFYVKVFDPNKIRVSGLKAGFVLQPSSFLVDTEGLGEGPLVITISNLTNGAVLPAKVIQESGKPHLYQVQYIAPTPGFYRIEIRFANVEAPGSPFTVEVIDPSLTSITGIDANALVTVGKVFLFNFLAQSSSVSLQNLKIVITDDKGMTISPRILDNRNGSANVEFTPVAVGLYRVEISYFGQPIKGSPFVLRTFDASRVKILNWKTVGKIGKEVTFDVDISKAGPGELDIKVSGGEAPYKIKEKESGKYQVTFIPKQPGTLTFSFLFNKIKILGGPWTCTIQSPPTIVVSGNGVEPNPPLPVNVPTTFTAKVTGPAEDIVVHVTGPNGEELPSQLISSQNNVFKYQYTPVNSGTHHVEILMEGTPVNGSPFTSRAYSPGSVIIGDVPGGIVGMTLGFPVDTTHAGEGQLEVLVENGSLQSNIVQTGKGIYNVTFVPREAKIHQIVVKFNGQQVKGSPLSANVLDLSRIIVTQDYKVPVNKSCLIRLNIAGAGSGKYNAIARAPSGAQLMPGVKEVNKRFLDIDFVPTEVGIYEVEVDLDGNSLPINPIHVSVYDISKIKVRDIKNGFVQKQMKIIVESSDPGEGDLKFSVSGPNGNVLNNVVEQNSSNSYSVVFTPVQQGTHHFSVTFNDEAIPGSPFSFMCYDVDRISVSGKALDGFPCNKQTFILVGSSDSMQCGNCEVRVTDSSMRVVPVRLTEVSDGAVRADFTGTVPGDYKIDVKCYGQTLTQSPFHVKCYDVNKVIVSPISTAIVGVQASFNISVKDAGEGTLELGITSPQGQQVANKVSPMGAGQFVVNFVPLVQGTHTANISFNDEPVTGSPFNIQVNDPSKIYARGEGLDVVKCNTATSFLITSTGVNESDLNIRITGPRNTDVRYRAGEQGPGVYKVDYTPTTPGDYVIEISAFGKPINYSPFTAKCWDSSKVTTTKVTLGRVGVQTSFNIDASNAGEGSMEISITSPSGQSLPNNVIPLGPGMFVINFTPLESGVHKANITFNRENVNGSPFQFNVIDLARANAKGDGFGLVKVNTNASFVITAPGAQERDVEVYIYAPNGKEIAYKMNETSPNNFRVDFTPNVAGDYRIEINYFGLALSGNPYACKAWDSSKVVVSNVKSGRVGMSNAFNVDAGEAGEGTMEIGITSPSGQNIHNNVVPIGAGKFEVSSLPQEAGQYKITVTFNKENVPGSPFSFLVTDLSKVAARGDGLGVVKRGVPTSFTVFAPVAQQKDLDISVIGPDNNEIMTRITETGANSFRVEYTPTTVGLHNVKVLYFGQNIPSSPFPVRVWDPSTARLNAPQVCKVGKQCSLQVDAKSSGDGSLDVNILQPSGRPLLNNVSSRGNIFEVVFVTTEPGLHKVNASLNNEAISGSPTTFLSIDPSKVIPRGDGLGVVPCNQPATFNFRAPAASYNDIGVKITGPDFRDVPHRLIENGDQFSVEYKPLKAGDYTIEVSYFGENIQGSPFTSKAFDPSMVHLSSIQSAPIKKTAHFNVNTSNAGVGQLEVYITVKGAIIPAALKGVGGGSYDVAFTPQVAHKHDVSVKFNGVEVAGSPFQVYVKDGSRATASGEGLQQAKANIPTSFNVMTNNPMPNDGSVEVVVTDPRGQVIPSQVQPSGTGSNRVDYTPREPGLHRINVKYAGLGIHGNPFSVNVVDPSLVRLGYIPMGVVGKPVSFEVDATRCGNLNGPLNVDVRGQRTKPVPKITSSHGIYTVTFVATENVPHTVNLTYAGETVIGSPAKVNFMDPQSMHVRWDSLKYVPIQIPVSFELEMGDSNSNFSLDDGDVTCRVKDASGRNVACQAKKGPKSFHFEFLPVSIGPHAVEVQYGGSMVPGTPHTCYVYDSHRVVVNNLTNDNHVGMEAGFDVDTSRAGEGVVEVHVMCGGTEVLTHARQVSAQVTRYTFVPVLAQAHMANVKFNSETVSGSPFTFQVMNPADQLRLLPVSESVVVVGQPVVAQLSSNKLIVNSNEIKAEAKNLNGEVQNVNVSSDLDGTVKLIYVTKSAGTYKLDVTYAGRSVAGSPLLTDVFDPIPVVVHASKTGIVGQPLSFEVLVAGAGKAPLDVEVLDTKDFPVSISKQILSNGQRITYTPQMAGLHTINVQFGGLKVPGTPVHQQIVDDFMPIAHGDGLISGIEGKLASFIVETKDNRGKLDIQVQGPNTIAAVKLDEDPFNKLTRVSYTPVETGLYRITIVWNGKEIIGSPYTAKVTSPGKVKVIGGWNSLLDHNCRIPLVVDERKCFDVDCSDAGPGDLRINLTGPDGIVPTNISDAGNGKYKVDFVPGCEGDYCMKMYYDDAPLEFCPINGTAVRFFINQQLPPQLPPQPTPQVPRPQPPSPQPPSPPKKCVASGLGLSVAHLNEMAEFYVLSGSPSAVVRAQVIGPDNEIPVTPVNSYSDLNLHKFFYTPQKPGPYFIYITCNGNPVDGSPFKVFVATQDVPYPPIFLIEPPPLPTPSPPQPQPQPQPVPPKVPECSTLVIGPGKSEAIVDKVAEFIVDGAIQEPIISLIGPNGNVAVQSTKVTSSRYLCSYIATSPGIYLLSVVTGGINVCGSPFRVKVTSLTQPAPPEPCGKNLVASGPGLGTVYEKKLAEFVIEGKSAEIPRIVMVGSDGEVPVQCVRVDDSHFRCTYTPLKPGVYLVSILCGRLNIIGSPYKVTVLPESVPLPTCAAVAVGEGLISVAKDKRAEFVVDGVMTGSPLVDCRGPTGPVRVVTTRETESRFRCVFYPPVAGMYSIAIVVGGAPVCGSPFTVNVTEDEERCYPERVLVIGPGISGGVVNSQSEFIIDGSAAGDDFLPEIQFVDPRGFGVPMNVTPIFPNIYGCSYVPIIPGRYAMNITLCGRDIPGSPFSIDIVDIPSPPPTCDASRVAAIGAGLSIATVNKLSEFIVDGCSDSQLSIKMYGSTRDVPVQITKITDGRFKCSYIPDSPGMYVLLITCCGMQIPGSPYKVNVGSGTTEVIPVIIQRPYAYGQGLNLAQCGQMAQFTLEGTPCQPRINMIGASGEVKVTVEQVGEGVYECSYIPQSRGVYLLSVACGDVQAIGSPFKVVVVGCDEPPAPPPPSTECAVAIGPGLSEAYLNKVAEFLIDGSCDSPNIKMTGTKEDITVTATPAGPSRYKCSYVPKSPGVYLLSISCKNCQVNGSPFKVVVPEPSEPSKPVEVPHENKTIVAIGSGLSMACPNQVSEFIIDGAPAGCLQVQMLGDGGEVLVRSLDIGSGRYLCSYMPHIPGKYQLSILCNNQHIRGSPFKVDVPKSCGEMPPQPAPQEPPPLVLITPECETPEAIGSGLTSVRLNEVAEFLIDGCCEGGPKILLTGASGNVPVNVTDLGNGRFKCSYKLDKPGVYLLNISCNGTILEGSPFRIVIPEPPAPVVPPQVEKPPQPTIQPPPLIPVFKKVTTIRGFSSAPGMIPFATGSGLYIATVNQQAEFVINSPDDPEIQMSSAECDIFVKCLRVGDNEYMCSYVPSSPGLYMLIISINGVQLSGSPFRVVVNPNPAQAQHCDSNGNQYIMPSPTFKVSASPNGQVNHGSEARKISVFSSATASGPGLDLAFLNVPSEFFVENCQDEPKALLFGLHGNVKVTFEKININKYRGSYTITKPGTYLLGISCGGLLVAGSPFRISVQERVTREFDQKLYRANNQYELFVDLPENSAPLPPRQDLQPLPQKIVAIGQGLTTAYAQQVSNFVVDASNAGHGRLQAKLIGLSNSIDVTCNMVGDGRYDCRYVPNVLGAYLLNVTWADQPIPGSPFKVTVLPSTDPYKVIVSGDSLQTGGSIGTPVYIMVDATNTGKDDLKATCQGPNNFINCKIEEVNQQRYNISFTPQEAGSHNLQIYYGNIPVPGSPFSIKVNAQIDPHKVSVTGEGIQDGVLATFNSNFVIDTRGAGPGQLNVRMRGKKDTFKIEMKRDPNNPRKIFCKFNPTEVGVYILEVKWSGLQVPGSPFRINIFDTMQELNQFKSTGGSGDHFGIGSDFYGTGGRSSLNGGYNFSMYE